MLPAVAADAVIAIRHRTAEDTQREVSVNCTLDDGVRGSALGLRPVQPNVGLRVAGRPLIQHRSQVLIHALLGQVGLQHAHDHDAVLGGEVLDVLGHQRSILPSGCGGDLPVRAGVHPEVADMHRVMTALDEPRAGTGREHLVDEKSHDAMRRARCSAS